MVDQAGLDMDMILFQGGLWPKDWIYPHICFVWSAQCSANIYNWNFKWRILGFKFFLERLGRTGNAGALTASATWELEQTSGSPPWSVLMLSCLPWFLSLGPPGLDMVPGIHSPYLQLPSFISIICFGLFRL